MLGIAVFFSLPELVKRQLRGWDWLLRKVLGLWSTSPGQALADCEEGKLGRAGVSPEHYQGTCLRSKAQARETKVGRGRREDELPVVGT